MLKILIFLVIISLSQAKNVNELVVKLKNVATGKYLDSNENGNVYAIDANNGDYQKWIIENDENNGIRLVNLATNRTLDSDANGNVYTLAANGGNYQVWGYYNDEELINLATDRVLGHNSLVRTFVRNGMNYQKWIQEF